MSNNKIIATGFTNSKGLPEPKESVDKRGGYIKWGKKNDYPYYLIDMFNGSAWHQGIIKAKTYYIAGKGFKPVAGSEPFLENIHSDFSIEEIAKNVSLDFELFDGFAVCGTWNREGTKVVRWEHLDFDKLRLSIDGEHVLYSDDWEARKQDPEKTGYREYPLLSKDNKQGKFVIYFKAAAKQAKGEKGYYPKPTYVGGLTAINTDVLISKYHLYEIQNGFKGGTLVNFANGQPETTEQENAIRDQVKGSSTNIEDTNTVVITFSEGKDNAPTVMQLNGNDLADRYDMTEKSVQQNLLVSHNAINPILFGIKTEGQLGGAQELLESYEIFKNLYVESRQRSIEYIFNYMAELSGYTFTLELDTPSPIGMEDAEDATSPNIDGAPEETAEDVQSTALNGAQIASLVSIIDSVGTGVIGEDSAIEVIMASFPLIGRAQAERIVKGDMATGFSKKKANTVDDDLKIFAQYGRDKSKMNVVKSIPVRNDYGMEDVEAMEMSTIDKFDTIGQIRASLTDFDRNVLDALKRGETADTISNALNRSVKDITESMDKLTGINLIKEGKPTDLAEDVLQGLDTEIDGFEIVYTYEVKPALGAEIIPTTRDFCRELIRLNKAYTRSEIASISGSIGRDVFRYRGGFYHNPDTDRTTPWCRHEWRQQIVTK